VIVRVDALPAEHASTFFASLRADPWLNALLRKLKRPEFRTPEN
jgi:hypothetical protein